MADDNKKDNSAGTIIKQLAAIVEKTRTTDDYLTGRGDDWWKLSAEEEAIFCLDLTDMPLLVAVWTVYQAVLGITNGRLEEKEYRVCEAAITDFPWLSDCAVTEKGWLRFAAIFGVNTRNATAFHWKEFFWEIRNAGLTYKDETP